MSRFLPFAAVVSAVLFSTVAHSAPEATGDPGAAATAVVEQFHATVLDVMKNAKTLGITGRYKRFSPEIGRVFNSQLMISLAAGRYWREADATARRQLTDAFRKLSTATYAARFTGYSGERFELLGAEAGPRMTQIVRTRMVSPDSEPVRLSYVLRKGSSGWQIVDVLLDNGISELAVRRSEYSSVLRTGGVAGLVKLLNDKTAQLLGRKM